MKFCHECGAALAGSGNFCPECGQSITGLDDPKVVPLSGAKERGRELDQVTAVGATGNSRGDFGTCAACGLKNEEGARFCADCGGALEISGSDLFPESKEDSGVAEGLLAGLTGAGCGCGCLLPAALIGLVILFAIVGVLL